jgi:hypothetical protein
VSFLWHLQGLAVKAKSRDLGMCRLRTADIRDGWHGNAQQPFAVANLVSCRAHHHQPFQRHVSAATSGATWPWQLQDGSPSSLGPMALLGDLLLQKLRRSMVNPDRNPLKDLVEIDETEMPFRSRHDPEGRPKGGRSPVGKMFVVCAVELSSDGHPRRIRMKHIPDGASKTLHGFIGQAVEPGAHIITDGWLGYENPPANTHEAKVVSGKKAHDILHWVHRVFSNLKTWAKGVFHGLRKCHLQRYLDEFVFRWNRRRHMRSAFDTLLGIGVGLGPATYRDFVEQRA